MPPKDEARDLREDEDADTRDIDKVEKNDEEQEVRDADADTADEMRENARDDAEINRKVDSLMESVSALSQVIAQLAKDSGTRAPATPSPDTVDEDATPLEELDYSL